MNSAKIVWLNMNHIYKTSRNVIRILYDMLGAIYFFNISFSSLKFFLYMLSVKSFKK